MNWNSASGIGPTEYSTEPTLRVCYWENLTGRAKANQQCISSLRRKLEEMKKKQLLLRRLDEQWVRWVEVMRLGAFQIDFELMMKEVWKGNFWKKRATAFANYSVSHLARRAQRKFFFFHLEKRMEKYAISSIHTSGLFGILWLVFIRCEVCRHYWTSIWQ